MKCHSQDSEPRKWSRVKAQIIFRFHTVQAAASLARCHPNAFRLAARGECPRVVAWLKSQHIAL